MTEHTCCPMCGAASADQIVPPRPSASEPSVADREKDSARLDWIIENIEYPKGLSLDHLMSKASYAESFRAAIDAAMSTTNRTGGENA